MGEKLEMKIGRLEKASGMERSTIHHYVREGILHPPHKTGRTMAYYDETHLNKLLEIRKIKLEFLKKNNRSRMPIEAIKYELEKIESAASMKNPETRGLNSSRGKQREKKKKEIIEATMRLYLEKGYYQTNLRDIASAVGMSPSNFYAYFPNKRELFAEIIEQVISKAINETEKALENETVENKRMIILFQAFQNYYPIIGKILNQLRAGAANNDKWAHEKIKNILNTLIAFVSKLIEKKIQEGYIRNADAELLSYVMIGGGELMEQRTLLDDKYTPEQIINFWWDCVQRILRPSDVDGQ